jgi:hypothetical protein
MSQPKPKPRVRASDKEFTFNNFEAWQAAAKMMRNRDDITFVDDGDFISFAFEPIKQKQLQTEEQQMTKIGFYNKQNNFGYVDALGS